MKIEKIDPQNVYDISVADVEHYILENGVVTHNTGSYYGSDTIFIVGRRQDKDGTEVTGYDFVLNIEKSRFVKEKSKFPISIAFSGGMNRWSGLLELALEGQYLVKPKNGWYALVDRSTGEVLEPSFRASQVEDNGVFWNKLLDETDFSQWVENKFKLATSNIMAPEEVDLEVEEV